MNFDSIRRIVSGKKSRLIDDEIGTDLDLSYITDRIIIMGYPASGLESLYRNRRKDVRRWLEARHGKHYRIYNFCPRKENEYEASYFHDQVRRFPFPDHHAPPLSMVPLFVHNITCFLASSPENVAVIHCKAGKGRSGTMTVCYLLTLAALPQPPRFKDLYIKSIQQLDEANAALPDPPHSSHPKTVSNSKSSSIEDSEHGRKTTPGQKVTDLGDDRHPSGNTSHPPLNSERGTEAFIVESSSDQPDEIAKTEKHCTSTGSSQVKSTTPPNEPFSSQKPEPLHLTLPRNETVTEIMDDLLTPGRTIPPATDERSHSQETDVKLMADMAAKILSLFQYHTSRRMADPTSVPYGISIPSQRRSVRYWGDILLGRDPRPDPPTDEHGTPKKQIEIQWIKVYVPDTVRYAKIFTSKAKVAVQLARYKDSYTQDLRKREMKLRKSGHYPVICLPESDGDPDRNINSDHPPEVSSVNQRPSIEDRYDDEKWEDRDEMIRPFASFGQDKRNLRKHKSWQSERSIDEPDVERRNTESYRPPGSRASMATAFTTDSSTTESIIHIDDSQLEETFSDIPSEHEDQIQSSVPPSRFLTPVRLYDFPSSPTDEGNAQFRKVKGGKNIIAAGGVKVDADCEILLRIVLGSTGKNHASLLPDATLLGYLWFIPAFHEPNFGTFSSTSRVMMENEEEGIGSSPLIVTSFPKEEIDFLNANVSMVEVAWKRVN